MALSNGVLAPTPPVTVPKANKGDRPGDLPWQEDTDFGGVEKQYDVTQEVVLNLEFVSDGWARVRWEEGVPLEEEDQTAETDSGCETMCRKWWVRSHAKRSAHRKGTGKGPRVSL